MWQKSVLFNPDDIKTFQPDVAVLTNITGSHHQWIDMITRCSRISAA
jgi:hypothetical protein